MSTPIAIKSTSSVSSVASSPSSGLYVPVHKRRSSSVTRTDDSMSIMSSSRPSSRAESHAELGAEHSETGHGHSWVYSRDMLMALAKSPLATMPKEVKDELRERLPEIVLSRKHRKAMEFRALMQQRAEKTQAQTQGQQTRAPVQAQQVNNAHTGSKNIESVQQQQSHRGAAHYHASHQPARALHHPQKQLHTQAPGQIVTQHPVLRNSHPRPVGRAVWSAPKLTTGDMSWRTRPASISVA
ncbi:hypothetical protein AX14_014262 [Amanita brunnescens Koide BX004]|nr:hypothetical protein AX14_014262 [Amanita brunnescens Koide BX004]